MNALKITVSIAWIILGVYWSLPPSASSAGAAAGFESSIMARPRYR